MSGDSFTSIRVRALTLTSSLQPYFTLVGMDCPYNKDGQCSGCRHFHTVLTNGEPVFAYMTFEGYCSHPK